MRRVRSDMEKSLAHPKRGARDVSMAPVVLLCAAVLGGGVARGDVVRDVLEDVVPGVVPGIELPEGGVTAAQALQSVQTLEAGSARLANLDAPGWMMGLVPSALRGEMVQAAEQVLQFAGMASQMIDAMDVDGMDGGDADRVVLARVAVVPLRAARACLALAVLERDGAAARLWAERGREIADQSEGVSAWTQAERAVLLGQAHVLLGDGAGALRVIRGAQESLRDATRAQRMEALMALVRGTAQAAGIAEAEGVWHRIVDRPPFVEDGRIDVGAKAMAIGVLTQARLEASEGVAERRRVRREASDMLARLLGETDEQSGEVYHQLGRLRDPGMALADQPLPVVVGSLFGDFRNREVLEAICRADVRSVPEGAGRTEVMLAAVTFLYMTMDDALQACAVEYALTLLEQHADEERVRQLPGLLMPMADQLATEARLERARAIEKALPDGQAKGQMRLAIARAMVEAWDGTGEPPDIDAVLAELYEDELRERGVEFRRAFWKRVLVREEDRVAAGGEMRALGPNSAKRLIQALIDGADGALDAMHALHVLELPLQPNGRVTAVYGTLPERIWGGALKILETSEDPEAFALRAREAVQGDKGVADSLAAYARMDANATARTWRVAILFDSAGVLTPDVQQIVGLDREPIEFVEMNPLGVLRAARWGVEEQGYELTPGMRRVLLRCSASARDAELARWLAETIGERARGGEERLLLGEAWLAAGEDERAFGVYRQLALDLEADDPRAYEYWASYARMLEILERKNEMGTRSVEMRREIDRLRALPGYELFEDARWAIDKVARSVDR